MAVEIYMCKEGQQLKDGKLEISHDINSKRDAEVDARERCKYDKKLFKVTYYRVDDEGNHRVMYSYTNPYHQAPAPAKQKHEQHVTTKASDRRRRPQKQDGIMDKVLKGLGMK